MSSTPKIRVYPTAKRAYTEPRKTPLTSCWAFMPRRGTTFDERHSAGAGWATPVGGPSRSQRSLEDRERSVLHDLHHGRMVGVTRGGEREVAQGGREVLDLGVALADAVARWLGAGAADRLSDQICTRVGLGRELVGVGAVLRLVVLEEGLALGVAAR